MRVALIGDLQRTGPIEVWRERNDVERALLLRQLAADQPDALVLLGDMVWWGASDEEWDYFDRVMEPVRSLQIPTLAVVGNHEYYGEDASAFDHLRSRFDALKEVTWYTRVFDSVAYVVLNTNVEELSQRELWRQYIWFRSTMKTLDDDPSVRAVVVCGHHPPFTNSDVVSDEELLQQHFVPSFLLSKKGAFWFAGHAHTYERFAIGDKQFIVSGGGGGPRQQSIRAIHRDVYEGPPLRPFHYVIVERHGGSVTARMTPLRRGPVLPDIVTVDIDVDDRSLTSTE